MRTCPTCAAANPETSERCSSCGGSFELSLATAEKPGEPPPRSDSDSSVHGRFLPGTKIAGRYRIVSLVGRGGMGEVAAFGFYTSQAGRPIFQAEPADR